MKTQIDLHRARLKAALIVDQLALHCRQIEIAGSIRRERSDVGDIEICAIPHPAHLMELMQKVNNDLGAVLKGKFPSKYTHISTDFCGLDLFWLSPRTWGMGFFIRTGSALYVRDALARWKRISNGGCCKDCRLWDGKGNLMETPTEKEVFELLEMKYVEPKDRNVRFGE